MPWRPIRSPPVTPPYSYTPYSSQTQAQIAASQAEGAKVSAAERDGSGASTYNSVSATQSGYGGRDSTLPDATGRMGGNYGGPGSISNREDYGPPATASRTQSVSVTVANPAFTSWQRAQVENATPRFGAVGPSSFGLPYASPLDFGEPTWSKDLPVAPPPKTIQIVVQRTVMVVADRSSDPNQGRAPAAFNLEAYIAANGGDQVARTVGTNIRPPVFFRIFQIHSGIR
jgi:hypothetical protein